MYPYNICFTLIFFIATISALYSQQTPYNPSFHFTSTPSHTLLQPNDSLKAVFIEFLDEQTEIFCQTLRNNPQLKEVQVDHPPQAAIDSLAVILGDSITHLFITGYVGELHMPSFARLELFSIRSDSLLVLDMSAADLDSMYILNIESELLTDWKAKPVYPGLGLIDMNTPVLSDFPIQSLPSLGQMSIRAALNKYPVFLCGCKDLRLMSFVNYGVIEVDPCFEQLIYNGFYSDMTIYGGRNGAIKYQLLSKDRQ